MKFNIERILYRKYVPPSYNAISTTGSYPVGTTVNAVAYTVTTPHQVEPIGMFDTYKLAQDFADEYARTYQSSVVEIECSA